MLGDEYMPKEWLVQVIDRLSKPCEYHFDFHNDSEEDPWLGLHLVVDCYDDLPMFALGSRELAELTVRAKDEATWRCCDPVDEALKDRHLVSRYGLTVATDILTAHKRDGDKLMERKSQYVDRTWANIVKDELMELSLNANQPQDDKKEIHLLHVKDQIRLLLNSDLHLVQQTANEIEQRANRDNFQQ